MTSTGRLHAQFKTVASRGVGVCSRVKMKSRLGGSRVSQSCVAGGTAEIKAEDCRGMTLSGWCTEHTEREARNTMGRSNREAQWCTIGQGSEGRRLWPEGGHLNANPLTKVFKVMVQASAMNTTDAQKLTAFVQSSGKEEENNRFWSSCRCSV